MNQLTCPFDGKPCAADRHHDQPPRNGLELFQRMAGDPDAAALIVSALRALAGFLENVAKGATTHD